jgi:spore coat protein H
LSNSIPSYYISIEEGDKKELKKDIWNDMPVPAYLKVGKKTHDIDISYRGAYTREFPKKSYWIDFINPSRFNGYREIHLNAEYKDPSLLRNKLSLDFFQDIGVLAPDSQHINLTLNKSYKGVYLQLEAVDDLFLTKRGLPEGPIYYAVNNNANFSLIRKNKLKDSLLLGYEQKIGNLSDDAYLENLIDKLNTAPQDEFPHIIVEHLNIEKYFRWLCGAVCTMNNDGFTHNYALYRNSQTRLFEIIPWDYDATWGRKVSGGIMRFDYVPIEGRNSNHLTELLLGVPEFRKLYRGIMEEILETQFTIGHMENKIVSLHQTIRPHVLRDPYKKKDIKTFDGEPEFIFQFIRDRSSYLKDQLVKFKK